MTDIAPIFPSATQPTAQSTTARSTISSDFETFLKMLTVQMENQDPLNPIESSEYAVQLATFSSVEQQVQTNDLLTAMLNQTGAGGIAEYAGWVGMAARSTAPAQFNGAPMSLSLAQNGQADKATLVVTNEQGVVVQRVDVTSSGSTHEWTGLDNGGVPFPNGTYGFEMEFEAEGSLIGTGAVQSYSEVVEVRIDPAGTALVLDGGGTIPPGAVTALRGL